MKRSYCFRFAQVASLLLSAAIQSWAACSTNSTSINSLPTLGGAFFDATALNNAGQITGFATRPDGAMHAFLIGSGGITDLGTVGGTSSQGFALNSAGHVVGSSSIADESETHAFLYDSEGMTDLGTLGGPFCVAIGINEGGQVIGNSLTLDFTFQAFTILQGSLTNLGTLGGFSSVAEAINNAGTIVGSSTILDELETHAFIYTNGTMVDLGTLGGFYSAAFAVNQSNVVVGESTTIAGETHAFVYSGVSLQDLNTLGGTYSTAFAVNNAGLVLGVSSTTGDVEYHGFVYSGGGMMDLGTLGGNYSTPMALNNLGQVVGNSANSNGNARAFLWQNGTMTDLNELLPAGSGWVLENAKFINDSGTIVGTGTTNGVPAWFVLTAGSQSGNNPPMAAAGADQNVSCQTVVTLNAGASNDPDGDALTYQWSYAGNVFSTNASAAATFDVGSYTIVLTVTDPCGASSQDEVLVTVTDTQAPSGSAPASVTVPIVNNCQAAVPSVVADVTATDNCTPANSIVVTQNPTAGTLLGLGQHNIVVTVTDASNNSSTANVALNIVDTTAPTIVSAPTTLSVSTGANCQGLVPDVFAQIVAADNCTAAGSLVVTQSPQAGTSVSGGQHTIVVTVKDASGNSTSTNVTLNVTDMAAPVISSVSATPNVLSPPNKQLVPVTVSVVASDNCDSAPISQIISITSNDAAAAGDMVITGPLTATLRASKSSGGDERVYTITVQTQDASGNSSTATVTVTVPKNKNGKN